MCGRYTFSSKDKKALAKFRVDKWPEGDARYNIAPGHKVSVVRKVDASNRADLMLWGLIPHWSKDSSWSSKLFNARSETISEKPSFRDAFKRQRCLIPADGFFEWKKVAKKKEAHFISLQNREPFAFAGIWDSWRSPEGKMLDSCSVITTEANELMRPLHHRMPVILNEQNYDRWLDEGSPTSDLKELLTSLDDGLKIYRVGDAVNKVGFDEPECLHEFEGGSSNKYEQGELF